MANLRELGVSFDHWCFACGRQNPTGLHLDFDVARDRATARYTGNPSHQGYDGFLHGGVVTALLDETMGWAFFQRGVWGVTARLTITFREPVVVGEELLVSGWIVRERSRAIETRGQLERARDGVVLAEADGLFLRMPEERQAELERRYAGATDTFATIREAIEREEQSERRAAAARAVAGAPASRSDGPQERSEAARPKAGREEEDQTKVTVS
ncbi:MAG: PaaI family thioesterase [Actinomycetota bacterium]|nr:PaaI family thioesterase [Actinomycetota bacterium]